MKIANSTKIINVLSKALKPIIKKLFPNYLNGMEKQYRKYRDKELKKVNVTVNRNVNKSSYLDLLSKNIRNIVTGNIKNNFVC